MSPILRTLVFSRIPVSTKAFVREVCNWKFSQIIPCHFEGPFKAGPRELAAAYGFLAGKPIEVGGGLPFGLGGSVKGKVAVNIREEDLATLSSLEESLASSGTLYAEVAD